MTGFRGLLRALSDAGVEHILVGGVAAPAGAELHADHRSGGPRPTHSSTSSARPVAPKDLEAIAELEAIREERGRFDETE